MFLFYFIINLYAKQFKFYWKRFNIEEIVTGNNFTV